MSLKELVLNIRLESVVRLAEKFAVLLLEVILSIVLKLVELASRPDTCLLSLVSDLGDPSPKVGRLVFHHIENGATLGAPPLVLLRSCLLLPDFQIQDRLLVVRLRVDLGLLRLQVA